MTDDDNTDGEAPLARGTDTLDDIDTSVGDSDMPRVKGTDHLSDKDPSEITMADLAGMDEDEKQTVLDFMETVGGSETGAQPSDDGGDVSPDDGDARTQAGETDATSDESDATVDEFEPPEPATLDETGLLDEDGGFPWEGDAIGETDVGEGGIITKFEYKRTNFEVREPEDRTRFERNFEQLQGVRETQDEGKRRAISDKNSKKIAEQTLTVEGHAIDDVYKVKHNGSAYVVPDPDGSKGLAHSDAALPLWDAMTWFDQFKVGMQIGRYVLGDRQFRSRVS